ncbi:MAG: AAA family ATPase [Rhodobacterales bacterium]|nr:AAA family ATPase [Rhodobacterales bacterium]
MTLRILSGTPNRETRNAELLRDALIASEPRLDHPDITADILCGLPLPGREIDLLLLYHDARDERLQLKTSDGKPIHSFVLVIEVKQHSPDLIRFEGPRVLVRYDQLWSDATYQCDDQTWALKRYQKAPYKGKNRRQPTFVQRAIWLRRAHESAFDGIPAKSSVPVHFADLNWNGLVDSFVTNRGSVRTLVDHFDHPTHHSIETLRTHLTRKVSPTRLDLRRVNALTQTRFDADKTAYIQNLGKGLLILRGRGGTGKTFALVQVALHLARQGKRTIMLTYNHGLIADINRALRFIEEKDPTLNPLPKLKTRYAFTQDIFTQTFGMAAEEAVKMIADIGAREERRLSDLMNCKEPIEQEYDFVLVDEGQDWEDKQRDLMFRLFGPEHVVVADGVDQFVGQDRCNWDRGDIPINRRHGLRASRRTKAATCQTVAEIALELGLSDWDLVPDPDTHGGRFTVVVEPDARRAVERGVNILESDQRQETTVKAVDNLICLPSAKMAKGINFSALFDEAIEVNARDSWRGFEEEDRRTYPLRDGQLRAVQYSSCRGMEGWTTLCLGLDVFFEFQVGHPRIDVSQLEVSLREKEGFLFSKELLEEKLARETRLFAVNWLMIPLTRSIDHLVVHISDERSELGRILRNVSDRLPGSMEWMHPEGATQ